MKRGNREPNDRIRDRSGGTREEVAAPERKAEEFSRGSPLAIEVVASDREAEVVEWKWWQQRVKLQHQR